MALLVNISESMLAKLKNAAKELGISINQFVVLAIVEKVARSEHARWRLLRKRAGSNKDGQNN